MLPHFSHVLLGNVRGNSGCDLRLIDRPIVLLYVCSSISGSRTVTCVYIVGSTISKSRCLHEPTKIIYSR